MVPEERREFFEAADAPSLNDVLSGDWDQSLSGGFRLWWEGNGSSAEDWDFDEGETVTAFSSNVDAFLRRPEEAVRLLLQKGELTGEDAAILASALERAGAGFGFTEPVLGRYKTLAVHRFCVKPELAAVLAVWALRLLHEKTGESKKALVSSPLEGQKVTKLLNPYAVGVLQGLRLPGKILRRNVFRLAVPAPEYLLPALESLFEKIEPKGVASSFIKGGGAGERLLRVREALGVTGAEVALFVFVSDVFWAKVFELLPDAFNWSLDFNGAFIEALQLLF